MTYVRSQKKPFQNLIEKQHPLQCNNLIQNSIQNLAQNRNKICFINIFWWLVIQGCRLVHLSLSATSALALGRAGQGRAGQGRAGQGRAGQGRAGQGRAGQGRAGPSMRRLQSHFVGLRCSTPPPLLPTLLNDTWCWSGIQWQMHQIKMPQS